MELGERVHAASWWGAVPQPEELQLKRLQSSGGSMQRGFGLSRNPGEEAAGIWKEVVPTSAMWAPCRSYCCSNLFIQSVEAWSVQLMNQSQKFSCLNAGVPGKVCEPGQGWQLGMQDLTVVW